MNRKKKLNETFQKKLKKAKSKLSPKKKDPYISKAERAKLAAEAAPASDSEQSPVDALAPQTQPPC